MSADLQDHHDSLVNELFNEQVLEIDVFCFLASSDPCRYAFAAATVCVNPHVSLLANPDSRMKFLACSPSVAPVLMA